MNKNTIYVKLTNKKYEVLKLQENKEVIKRYFESGDKKELEGRNIKFYKPI